jgi:hypothetical protein
VRTMIRELRGQIGTFCAFGSGATSPWTMPGARSCLSGRNPARCALEQRRLARGEAARLRAQLDPRPAHACGHRHRLAEPLPGRLRLCVAAAHHPALLHLLLDRGGL